MNTSNAMGSGDILWGENSEVPKQYANLPASEARAKIAQDKIDRAKRIEEQRKAEEQRKIDAAVKEALVANGVEAVTEEVVVESSEDISEKVEVSGSSFTSAELATVSNKVFEIASNGTVEITHIGEDCIKVNLGGVNVKITRE
jgi:hypothetical protein